MPSTATVPADTAVGATFVLVGFVYTLSAPGEAREHCRRCGDEGRLREFAHVDDGVCFACWGNPLGAPEPIEDIERRAANREAYARRKEEKRVAKVAKADRAREAELTDPIIALAFEWAIEDDGAGRRTRLWGAAQDCMYRMSHAAFTGLSERQRDMVKRAVAAHQERVQAAIVDAERPAAPVGRQEIEGRVLSTKWVESYHPWGSDDLKITLEVGDGWRVFVTCPIDLYGTGAAERGTRLAMTVTLEEPKDGDRRFRLGKRPTKARVIADAPEPVELDG